MTQEDATKILEAVMTVNSGDNKVEVSAEFGLDSENIPSCHIYIFGTRYTGGSREIVDSFASYDRDYTADAFVRRIMKYQEAEA